MVVFSFLFFFLLACWVCNKRVRADNAQLCEIYGSGQTILIQYL